MEIAVYIPIKVHIDDPIAALDDHINYWSGDSAEDSAHPTDLIAAAIRLGNVSVEIPDTSTDPDWVNSVGRILDEEWVTPLSRDEIKELEGG